MKEDESIDILIGDDEKTITDILDKLFTEKGFSHDIVNTKEDFLDKSNNKKYNILITDNGYTSYDKPEGIEMIKQIRATDNPNNDTPIILMSGHGNNIQERAKQAGAQIGISKPFDLNYLLNIVNNYINPEELSEQYL